MPGSTKTRRTTPLDLTAPEPAACSLDLRLRLLAQVPFFARLSPADIREVDRSFADRGFQLGDLIYAAGDPAGRLYVILSGTVKLVRHSLGGQDVLLDLLGPGEFFGALSVLGDEEYPDTASAQTGCCLISIEAADFQAIMQRYPSVALAVVDVIQARLHAAHDLIRQLSAQPVESRIAAALLKLADRMGRTEDGRTLIRAPLAAGPGRHGRNDVRDCQPCDQPVSSARPDRERPAVDRGRGSGRAGGDCARGKGTVAPLTRPRYLSPSDPLI